VATVAKKKIGNFEVAIDKKKDIPSMEIVNNKSNLTTRLWFLQIIAFVSSIISVSEVPHDVFATFSSLKRMTPASTKVKTIKVPSEIKLARASIGAKQAIKAAARPVIKIPSDIVYLKQNIRSCILVHSIVCLIFSEEQLLES